jgi:midasin
MDEDEAAPPEAEAEINEAMPDASKGFDEAGDTQQGTQTEQQEAADRTEQNAQDAAKGDQDMDAQDADASKGTSTRPAQPSAPADEVAEAAAGEKQDERQLGDALERWSRQLKAIDEAAGLDQSAQRPIEDAADRQEAVFAGPDQIHDNQALGATSASDAVKIRELDLTDEGADVDGFRDQEMDDSEMAPKEQEVTTIDLDAPTKMPSAASTVPDRQGRLPDEPSKPSDTLDIPMDVDEVGAPRLEPLDATSNIQFTFDSSDVSSAEAWQQYSTSVRPLSFNLTEQLRLILEPTQASRLEGDYRSGKRLNMKRIIPFIASEYTKDKIWLRRTKPFDRRYQIMIALDDSQSMSDPSTVHLAFQALALVSTSLARLEVGQVAVTSFGESVVPVHGFDSGPITEEAGQKILERFSFQQTKTDYNALLAHSIADFQEARQKASAGGSQNEELWQLQIIISDGLMSTQERTPALLRKARESKVLVVFVILDAATSRKASMRQAEQTDTSILRMTSVASYMDAQGKLQIETHRYLDSFPFEYYVVLRSAEELPDMLCRLLRQFFGMVRYL